jgi:O-antigen ligase
MTALQAAGLARSRAVCAATFLWGFALFMPVGMNYLGAGLTLVALASAGDWHVRLSRFRASPLRWPLLAFATWALAVLLLRPHYDETGLSAWHDFRIWVTLAVTVLLSADEALAGVRGFLAGALLALVAIVLAQTTGVPDLAIWHHVTVMKGNKSINDALLFTLVGASAAVLGLAQSARGRIAWARAAAAFAITLAAALLAAFALPSRTSLVGLVVAILAACLHQWRGRARALALAFCVALALAGALAWATPSIRQSFELGLHELQQARAGAVSEGSWVVRFHMYRETTRMMLDEPLAGWGLGSWTPEWQRRGPPLLADYSMPHNDFLWFGAETGVPGLLIFCAILLAGTRVAWRRQDLCGRLAFSANLLLLVATSLNSAFRDAAIGLSLPWIVFVYLNLAQAPGRPWKALPGRGRAASPEAPEAAMGVARAGQ